MIPACGGSWLSPRPFDWAAVMGERQLGGRGRKGAAAIAYTAVTTLPTPSSPSGRKPGTEGVGTGLERGPGVQEGRPEVRGPV